MKDYNIPASWLRDIATCGTSSHSFYRRSLWADWTQTQREAALSRFTSVLEKLEEYCKLVDKHAEFFNSSSSVWWSDISRVGINPEESYTPKQMLELVEQAIKQENESFDEELKEAIAGWE